MTVLQPAPLTPDALDLIFRARREGVRLTALPGGQLGMEAKSRPSDELLALLQAHKDEILALLVEPLCESFAVGKAKQGIWALRMLGFRPYLDAQGALIIADDRPHGKKGRDISHFMSVGAVFDDIVRGLADDPQLLDPS